MHPWELQPKGGLVVGWIKRLASRRRAAVLPSSMDAAALARAQWFERWGAVQVERNRYFVCCVLLCIALGASAMALAFLMPLKRVVPYIVRVADNGAVALSPASAQEYVPRQPERAYFLARWVSNLLALDAYLTERQLTEAYAQTRGLASPEFIDWLKQNRPLERLRKEPSLVQTVAINTVTPLQDEVVQVRVRCELRSLSLAPEVRRFQVTLRYILVPPVTEAEIIKNPIGLFVTHFTVNEELAG